MANKDLGDSLDSVEALIKKHEDFEKSLAAQEEKIKLLDDFATKLIQNEHYAHDDIAVRRDQVHLIQELWINSGNKLSVKTSDLNQDKLLIINQIPNI